WPRYRVDDFVLTLTVGHEGQFAIACVEQAPGHWDQKRHHILHDACELQSADASCGEREIDRTPRGDPGAPHVGQALVDLHTVAAPCEQNCEQAAGEPGADDLDLGGCVRFN